MLINGSINGYLSISGVITSALWLILPDSPENSRAIALIEAVKRAKNKILGSRSAQGVIEVGVSIDGGSPKWLVYN